MLLKVSPIKGVLSFCKQGKPSPRCVSLFEVLKCVKEVAYELALPPSFFGVHLVFDMSMLKHIMVMKTILFVGIWSCLMRIYLMRRSL